MTKQIADEAMTIEPHTCKHQCQYNDLMQSLDTERAAHEATKADSFDRGWNAAIEAAADVVCGYIHPDYGRLPGEAFASAQVRQLKKDTGNE
jgi:hypothetical protein